MAAIYMWFSPGEDYLLTSTIYPIEIRDELQLGISNTFGFMSPPIEEGVDTTVSYRSAVVTAVLLTENMDNEGVDTTVSYRAGTVTAVLLTDAMDDEGVDTSVSYRTADVTLRKVTALLPPEKAAFDVVCTTGSMELV